MHVMFRGCRPDIICAGLPPKHTHNSKTPALHTNTSYSQTRQLYPHTSTHTKHTHTKYKHTNQTHTHQEQTHTPSTFTHQGHAPITHTKHTDHTTLSLISLTPATYFVCVYCARPSTPSTHVSSQYTTLPPVMLPVLSRQVPLLQSAQRHHSCQSGELGLPAGR